MNTTIAQRFQGELAFCERRSVRKQELWEFRNDKGKVDWDFCYIVLNVENSTSVRGREASA